jgi:hypothetical protein
VAYLNSRPRTPEICPVCGENVPPRALACRECGADHNSGWRLAAGDADGLDLPDGDFDYDAFVEREFGGGRRASGLHPVWWITAIVVLGAMIAGALLAIF